MEKPIYVIGHKNPDSDSIISSIAYSEFKNMQGINTVACRLGECNDETKYLLKKFGFKQPELIHSAKCQLKDISMDNAVLVSEDITMKQSLDEISKNKNKGIFVVDENKKFKGLLSISDLTELWSGKVEDLTDIMQGVKLENIIDVLNAKVYYKSENFNPNGVVHILPTLNINKISYYRSIVIVGNSPDIQRYLIDCEASVIVVCGEDWIDDITLNKVKNSNTSIIHTPYSALTCSKLIFQAPTITNMITKDVISFNVLETVDDVSSKMAKTRFRTYPVLNDNEEVISAISRYHLFNYDKKKFILVDHNEKPQSVNDLEFAEILEIVDHHRFFGVETDKPINIIAKTVGACATIIADLYFQNNIKMKKNMAGLLLGAIISDTLGLKSPTTTNFDIEIANKLSEISNININDLNFEIVSLCNSILNKTYIELLYDDFKEFRIENSKIVIGQSQCKSIEEFKQIKDDFLKYIEDTALNKGYDLILIMFTDPLGSGSNLLFAGKKSWIIKEGFNISENGEFIKNIISRKKQVLPIIINILTK